MVARSRVHVVAALAVALITAACFAATVGFGWLVNWDDNANFLDNPHYRGLDWETVRWAATTTLRGPYQPLSWLSLSVDHALWGMDARGYHATNVLIHALAAVACVWTLRALLRCVPGDAASVAPRPLGFAAAAGALFFAIHPQRVESVAWVTERRDVLSGLFTLLALGAYLRAHSPGATRRMGWGALVCFALALLAKATAMTLPVALLVLDAWPLRRIRREAGRWHLEPGVLREKVPYLLCSVAVGVVAVLGQRDVAAMSDFDVHGAGARLVQAAYAMAFYPWKALAPVWLSPFYEMGILDLTRLSILLPAIAGVGLGVGLLVRARRWPALAVAWAFFAILVAPVSGLAQAGAQIAADRYSYLPGLAFAALFAGACARWPRFRPCACAWLVVLGALTVRQSLVWRDAETLWKHAVAVDPANYAANHYYGDALVRAGRAAEAEPFLVYSLRGRNDADAWNNLGVLRAMAGRMAEAVTCFERAVAADPGHAEARKNLAEARR